MAHRKRAHRLQPRHGFLETINFFMEYLIIMTFFSTSPFSNRSRSGWPVAYCFYSVDKSTPLCRLFVHYFVPVCLGMYPALVYSRSLSQYLVLDSHRLHRCICVACLIPVNLLTTPSLSAPTSQHPYPNDSHLPLTI